MKNNSIHLLAWRKPSAASEKYASLIGDAMLNNRINGLTGLSVSKYYFRKYSV